jgi:SUKH-3 immunity protein
VGSAPFDRKEMKPHTSDLLIAAGWFPGRTVGRAAIEAEVAEAGYSATEGQILFLNEFSGLQVHSNRGGRWDLFWIDIRKAASRAIPEWVEIYSDWSEDALLPIGYSNSEHLLILAGSDGSLYGGYDDNYERLGIGAVESLDNLLSTL